MSNHRHHHHALLAGVILLLAPAYGHAEETPPTLPVANRMPAVTAPTVGATPSAYIFRRGDKVVYYRDKVFIEGGQELVAPIILTYYGPDALSIMVAPRAQLTLNDIVLPSSREFLIDKDGGVARDQQSENTVISNTLGVELPGTFVEGRALIELNGVWPVLTIEEDRYGIRTLTLAQSRWEDPTVPGSVYLYNGYRIAFREDSSIESQMAFNQYAINGHLTKARDLTQPSPWGPPGPGTSNPYQGGPLSPGVCSNSAGITVDCITGLPTGRPVETTPTGMQPATSYTRPAIKVIGIIPFEYKGSLGTEGGPLDAATYQRMVSDAIMEKLASTEGIEVKVLELAPEDLSGTYVFNFAKRIGQKYECDAIIHGTIHDLGLIGERESRLSDQIKLVGDIEASLIDTTGGKFNWQNTDKVQKFVDAEAYSNGSSPFVKDLIQTVVAHLIGDMTATDIFAERDI